MDITLSDFDVKPTVKPWFNTPSLLHLVAMSVKSYKQTAQFSIHLNDGTHSRSSEKLVDKIDTQVNPYYRWPNFNDLQLPNNTVSQCTFDSETIAIAENIIQYYKNRIMLKMLSNGVLTQFYSDLYKILNEDITPDASHAGMIAKLPYFYYEDIKYQSLVEKYGKGRTPISVLNSPCFITLKPLQYIFVSRKSNELHEYWFTVDKEKSTVEGNSGLAMISVSSKNSLTGLVDTLFESNSIQLNCSYIESITRSFDLSYYSLNNIKNFKIIN